MSEVVVPSLFVVAGICVHAGTSHSFLALRRRAVTHLAFGLLCFLVFAYVLYSAYLYQTTTTDQYLSALRKQLAVSYLWNVLFVWFVALYSGNLAKRFLFAHNTLCIVVLILNWSLPSTLLYSEVHGLEITTLPWGEPVQTVDGVTSLFAWLHYCPGLLSFGFAYCCCYLQFRRGTYSSALFLALATSIQLLALLLDAMVDFADFRSIFMSEFAFLAFILLMNLRLADDAETADAALRQSELRFRQMAETIQEVFYLAEPATGKVLYISPAYEMLTGISGAAAANMHSWLNRISPGDRNRVKSGYEGLLRGVHFDEEYQIPQPDGSHRWVRHKAFPIYDANKKVYRAAGVAQDITSQKEAEASLRHAENLQRLTLENISDAVFITDDAGDFHFVCPNADVIFGYDVEEIQQMGNISQLVGGKLIDADRLEKLDEIRNAERRIQDKSGRSHDLLINVRRVSINGGTRLFVCRDISERKRAEEELSESERRLQKQFAELEQIYRTSPVGLCFMDRELRFIRINDELAAINGLAVEDHIGRHLGSVLPDIAATIEPIYRHVLETGEPALNFEVDKPSATNPDETRNYLVSYYPVTHRDGTVIGVSSVVQDITERKQTEQALLESEARTGAILASLSAHIAVVDQTGRIVAVNPAWERFARENEGSADGCNVGANYLDVCRAAKGVSADEAPRVADGLQAILSGAANEFAMEYPCHSATHQRWFLMHATPLRNDTVGAVLSHTDISDRIKAEHLLQASERRLRAILNAAADAIITIDKAGIINGINPATERMFGYRQDELVGQNINLLMSPPYSDEPEGNITRYLETGEPNIMASGREVTARRKDGVTFPIDLALSEVEQLGLFIGMIRDISERKELQRRVLEIAAEEQRRIGLELHDGTGQTLTGLSLFAGTMLDVLNIAERNESRGMVRWVFNDAEYQRLCTATARLAKGLGEANQHVHQLSHGIMPVQIDAEGLRSALEELAVSTNVQENMTCCFECSGSVAVKNNTTAMHLYRIAQEALNNAVRHGQADQIQILLLQIDDQVILEVADNGVGIDRSGRGRNGPAHGGMGLRIMDYRAGMIGGVLDVERNKTGGTTVRCAVSGA